MAMSDNPYAAPKADLSKAFDGLAGGSLQGGIEGRYSLSVDQIWSHAWKSTRGAKAPLVLAMLVFMAASVALSEVLALVGLDGQAYLERGDFVRGYLLTIVSGVILSPVTVPMMAGVVMMAARRAAGRKIRFVEMFAYFDRVVPLVALSVMSTFLMYVGFLLCILPGLYLAVAYSLAAPVLVDKNLGPWQALEASRKAIHQSWFSVCLLIFGTSIIGMVGSIFLITIVWSVPWMMLCFGTLYVTVFGLGDDEPRPISESAPI